ncbi:MAG: 50S ribosomal protein L25 [Marinilabiliales bacterium]|nr:MAG: 50S ribosomal protein L25 [Marinilabiliales bacterium]
MKKVSLSGSLRENVGKKDAKRVRREGNIPCVIYGGEKQIHFAVEELAFDKLIFTPDVYEINLTIDDKEYKAILQDVQYHPVTDKVLHADFLEVIDGKPVIVGVPVHLIGDSIGVLRGGKMIQKMHKLRVKGLITDIPEFIDVDIAKVNIGGSVKIREIELDKMSILDPLNSVIVRVKAARTVEEVEEDEDEDEEGEGSGEEGGDAPAETPAE